MNSETNENVAYVPARFHSPQSAFPICLSCFLLSPSLTLSLSSSLSCFLSLSFVDIVPARLFLEERESLHPVESGTGAQLQRLTSSLSARRFSPPAICTLSLPTSLALSPLSLNKPLTCCIQ